MNAGSRSLLPPAGTVDVWRIALDVPAAERERLSSCLDDGERRHAARMGPAGEHWAVARAARRELLARCSGIAAGALEFETEGNGKPRLAGGPRVHFNMSSRREVALLAISSTGSVGVDIERVDVPGDLAEVARNFLPAAEVEAILLAPVEQRGRRFALAWTRFEATRKLWGLGLDEPSDRGPATVRELSVPEGYVAALAAEGAGWSVSLRDAAEVLGASDR